MALAGKGRDGGLQAQGGEAWRVVRPSKPSKRNGKDMCKRAEEGGKGIDRCVVIKVVLD